VRQRLKEKLSDVQQKLASLQKLERELRLALRSCNREISKRSAHCPILRERNPRKPEGGQVKVEVLYVVECPSRPAAVKLVKEVLAAEGVAAEVHEVLVKDDGMADELRFCGSPTIRIDGRDVAGESHKAQSFALSCRLYPESKQIGLPPWN
jgi:hypothetical protein